MFFNLQCINLYCNIVYNEDCFVLDITAANKHFKVFRQLTMCQVKRQSVYI